MPTPAGDRPDAGLLLIPGPVSLGAAVQAELERPTYPHYGTVWAEEYHRIADSLALVFGTPSPATLLFGPGSAALEAAFGSALAPADEILVLTNGHFGDRLYELAGAVGLTPLAAPRPPRGRPIDPAVVQKTLSARSTIRAVTVVQHETSLGLVNPIEDIARVVRQHEALLITDAVSSLGGMDLRMDEWGNDICVTVGNKCLGGPVGVAPIGIGERGARAITEKAPGRGWYLNLANWRRFESEWGTWHPHPTTMPANAIFALGVAVDELLAEGLDTRFERVARVAGACRDGLRQLGFEMLVEDDVASPVTTAVWVPAWMNVDHFIAWLLDCHRIRIAGGIGDLHSEVFRVGHMGAAATIQTVEMFLAATAEYTKLHRG